MSENRNEKLLQWYEANGRKLAFRQSKNPYSIWISEIMAQQTRIDAMLPYYERFMAALPDLESLARCNDEQLLKLWQGLGYYARARNLKKAALVCMEKYDGKLPSTKEQLQELPGIGDYTSGAIASIAFGLREPAVDGNVLRVFSRLYEIEEDISQSRVQKKIRALVVDCMPQANKAGDFNQALMELGATICTPGTPHCEECPIGFSCKVCGRQKAAYLPYKKAAKPRRIEEKVLYIRVCMQEDDWYVQLEKRTQKGLLHGLYCFSEKAQPLLEQERCIELEPYNHVFSHIEWHMHALVIFVSEKGKDYYALSEVEEKIPIPSAMAPFYRQLKERKERECPKKS
jgi:A/G-specific adenine glycosylase